MGRRIIWMIIGNILLGIGSGCFRLAELGLDAYSCLVLGCSDLTGISFGTTMLGLNLMLLVVMVILDRKHIHVGTVANLVMVGYVSDGTVWLLQEVLGIHPGGFGQSLFLLAGLLLVGLGIALYTTPNLGVSPYDDMAFIIEERSKHRIKFHYARIIGDVVSVLAGVAFALITGESVFRVAGIGTICSAVLTGLIISFFKRHVAVPLVWGRKKDEPKSEN